MRTFDTRMGGLDAWLDGPIKCARIDAYPRQTFTADLLKIGTTYRHPKDGWKLKVTRELAAKIAASAERMIANGVPVPVLARHSFNSEPPIEDVLGYLRGVFVEDGWLRARLEFRGANAIEAGQRIDRVSIGLLPELVDGEGRAYFNAIQHVALTPYPLVDDQRGLVPIAASRGGVFNDDDSDNQEVLTMALGDEFAGPLGNNVATINKFIGTIA
ncbi:MAG: hypothetical protein IID40_07775 [Planctomycetes bacterium]|nr:hypothetical protein [Planctomycetota bacterium]